MKRHFFLAITAISCVFTSCSDPKQQYIDACNDGDFDEAREIVEGLGINNEAYAEGINYVNEKEIYKLLANLDKDNANRILFLYNTYESNLIPNMNDVAEVAISSGDSYLADNLIRAGLTPDERVIQAAINKEMIELVDLCLRKDPSLLSNLEVADFVNEFMDEADAEKHFSKYRKDILKKIRTDLQELSRLNIPPRPALGLQKSDHYGELDESYTNYNNAVENLNNGCINLLSQAISAGDDESIKKIISLMRPTLAGQNLGDWEDVVVHSSNSSVYNAFDVKEDYSHIERAHQMVEAAK